MNRASVVGRGHYISVWPVLSQFLSKYTILVKNRPDRPFDIFVIIIGVSEHGGGISLPYHASLFTVPTVLR